MSEKISLRKISLIIGTAMFIMAICSGFSYGVVHNSIFIKGDATATMSNILKSISLFRAEIFCWLIILLCDITVSWALYIYLRQVDKCLSLLGACFRLLYSAILGIAISNLIYILLLSSGDNYLAAIQPDQLKAQLMLYVNAFNNVWSFGLIIFGLHLFVIGYLVLSSNFIPRFLGILLLIASFSYIIIHSLHLFIPQYENTTVLFEKILSLPMAAGELGFGLWLLIKGGKIPGISR
ncbi:MAG: DUF4386 domain-containing protein [Firmicutes bacterium]|nr:DUF4386 domain-containing protein [Bacillota bacterium]